MFKYFLIFLFFCVEAQAAQPYYYYTSYWNGRGWSYQWQRGVRLDENERETKRLDFLERKYEIEQRKNDMRRRGILPYPLPPTPHPPEDAGMVVNGRKYASLAEFKKTPEWDQFVQQGKDREAAYYENARIEKQRNLEIIAKYRKMSSVDIARQEDLKRANAIINRGK